MPYFLRTFGSSKNPKMCYNTPVTHTDTGRFSFIADVSIRSIAYRYWVKHPVSLDLRPAVCVTTSANDMGCFVMTKKCAKCGSPGPFHRDKNGKDGLSCYCKICKNEQNRQWQERNQERHKEAISAWKRKNKKRNAEINEKWRKQNREKANSAARRRYQNNPEKHRETTRRFLTTKEGKEARRHNQAIRRARKRASEGSFTQDEWKLLCEQYGNHCLACGKRGNLTVDHVTPLSLGGKNTIDNIQPLCLSCNSAKKDKIIDYRTRPGILRWIQEKLF